MSRVEPLAPFGSTMGTRHPLPMATLLERCSTAAAARIEQALGDLEKHHGAHVALGDGHPGRGYHGTGMALATVALLLAVTRWHEQIADATGAEAARRRWGQQHPQH